MKRILYLLSAGTLAALLLGSGAWAQSLGDYAREQRAKKQKTSASSSKVYTDEDLPKSTVISESRPASSVPSSESALAAGSAEAAAKASTDPEERAKQEAEWKTKVADIKKNMAQLEREIDVLEREYKLRAVAFYTEAGNALLNSPKQWKEQEAKYQEDIRNKKKELQDAKDKLEQTREEIRKAGFSSSLGE